MEGKITGVQNHGSIVSLMIQDQSGRDDTVYWDLRAFYGMCSVEGINKARDLVGRHIQYQSREGEECIEFLD